MSDFLTETVLCVASAAGGYYGHWFKVKKDLTRASDTSKFEELKRIYPSNSDFLSPDPQFQSCARSKFKEGELKKLSRYEDELRLEEEFYFHDKQLDKKFKELRFGLLNFSKLVLPSMVVAQGSYQDIYCLRFRYSEVDCEKNEFEALAKEVNDLADEVIKTYKEFCSCAKKRLLL